MLFQRLWNEMKERLFSCYWFKSNREDQYCRAIEETQDTRCPLMFSNYDVLLHILSYCDSRTICRFSRTCSRAKEFVDANFFRLTQFQATLDVEVTSKVTTYKFQQKWGPNRIFKGESRSCSMQSILSQMTYASIESATVSYSGTSAMYCRYVLKELSLLKAKAFYFTWWARKTLQSDERKMLLYIRAVRPIKKDFLLQMSRMPLEALNDDRTPSQEDETLCELFLAVMQTPAYTEIHVNGAARTVDDCFNLFVKVLDVIVRKSHSVGKCTVYILITVPTEDLASEDVLAGQRVLFLRNKMENCGVMRYFEAAMVGPQHFIFLRPKAKSYVIRISQVYRLNSFWMRFETFIPEAVDTRR